MLDLKTFLKQKLFLFFTIFYTAIFIIVNVVFFFTNNAYINNTIERENDSLVEMTEHLITYTGEDNALVFLEHYGHTYSVHLTYEAVDGNSEFETTTPPSNAQEYTITIEGDPYARLYVDNNQSELVIKNTTYLLIFNGILIGIYVLGLWLFSAYFKKQYTLIIDDMNRIQSKLKNINEDYAYTFEEMDTTSARFDDKIKQIHELQKNHRKHIQSLAHDIKTPLTILRSTLEAVEKGRIELTKDVTDSLLAEITAIDALIPRLIESTREENRETIPLAEEVLKACRRQEGLLEEKNILVDYLLDDDVLLEIERETIHRIVDHLLSNVRMHAKDASHVHIRVKAEGPVLEVEDDGEGITREAIENTYVDKDFAVSETPGSGLGLSIVRHIVEEKGGTLEIRALKPRGTKVTVFFSS